MKIYIAGPLFTEAERYYLQKIDEVLKKLGFDTYLPHKDGGIFVRGVTKSEDFFRKDLEEINKCDMLVAVLNGIDVDSGTSWEIGFAYSKGIPVFGILDDTRKPDNKLLNPMIFNSIKKIAKNIEELEEELKNLK